MFPDIFATFPATHLSVRNGGDHLSTSPKLIPVLSGLGATELPVL